jgi:hypothetical protein
MILDVLQRIQQGHLFEVGHLEGLHQGLVILLGTVAQDFNFDHLSHSS